MGVGRALTFAWWSVHDADTLERRMEAWRRVTLWTAVGKPSEAAMLVASGAVS